MYVMFASLSEEWEFFLVKSVFIEVVFTRVSSLTDCFNVGVEKLSY